MAIFQKTHTPLFLNNRFFFGKKNFSGSHFSEDPYTPIFKRPIFWGKIFFEGHFSEDPYTIIFKRPIFWGNFVVEDSPPPFDPLGGGAT